jgi:hypothetical protein
VTWWMWEEQISYQGPRYWVRDPAIWLILQVTWMKGEEQISYQGPRSWVRDKMPDTAGDLVEGRGADLLPGPQVLGQN